MLGETSLPSLKDDATEEECRNLAARFRLL